jgi:hypothetical protein
MYPRIAHHDTIYRRLDLSTTLHMPTTALPQRTINVSDDRSPPLYLPVYVKARDPSRRMTLRVTAICPCERHLPVSRLAQHVDACFPLRAAFTAAHNATSV